MFGLGFTSIKFYAYLAVVILIAGLGFTTKVYHGKWQDAKIELALKQVALDGALEATKACSENTETLKKMSDEKTEIVKKAQTQAATIAKGNQALANSLLQATAVSPDKCIAAAQLYKDYKAQAGK